MSASHLTAYFTSALYIWCILVLSRKTPSSSEPLPRAIMFIVNDLQPPESYDKNFPLFPLPVGSKVLPLALLSIKGAVSPSVGVLGSLCGAPDFTKL